MPKSEWFFSNIFAGTPIPRLDSTCWPTFAKRSKPHLTTVIFLTTCSIMASHKWSRRRTYQSIGLVFALLNGRWACVHHLLELYHLIMVQDPIHIRTQHNIYTPIWTTLSLSLWSFPDALSSHTNQTYGGTWITPPHHTYTIQYGRTIWIQFRMRSRVLCKRY